MTHITLRVPDTEYLVLERLAEKMQASNTPQTVAFMALLEGIWGLAERHLGQGSRGEVSHESYSWTQPCCDDCWDQGHPTSPSPRCGRGDLETCVYCAMPTHSGIYVRVDPKLASYPSLER